MFLTRGFRIVSPGPGGKRTKRELSPPYLEMHRQLRTACPTHFWPKRENEVSEIKFRIRKKQRNKGGRTSGWGEKEKYRDHEDRMPILNYSTFE